MRQTQELDQEMHRAMTLRDRLERELDAFERSLARMRGVVRELPPDPDPGASVPLGPPDPGGP